MIFPWYATKSKSMFRHKKYKIRYRERIIFSVLGQKNIIISQYRAGSLFIADNLTYGSLVYVSIKNYIHLNRGRLILFFSKEKLLVYLKTFLKFKTWKRTVPSYNSSLKRLLKYPLYGEKCNILFFRELTQLKKRSLLFPSNHFQQEKIFFFHASSTISNKKVTNSFFQNELESSYSSVLLLKLSSTVNRLYHYTNQLHHSAL